MFSLTSDTDPVRRSRGGPLAFDLMQQARPAPGRPVGYLPIDPGTETPPKLNIMWHKLGEPVRPADELMHRFFRQSMQQLVEMPQFWRGVAFYPDEAGVLVARVVLRDGPTSLPIWVGYNARAVYAAGALALASTASGLLPESMRGDAE